VRIGTIGAMGAFDKAKDMTDKVKDVTEETVDKLDGVIDKVADKVDEKTGGKYSDKIDQVVEGVQNPAESTSRAEEPPSRPAP
jgi:gas vesicle protein